MNKQMSNRIIIQFFWQTVHEQVQQIEQPDRFLDRHWCISFRRTGNRAGTLPNEQWWGSFLCLSYRQGGTIVA